MVQRCPREGPRGGHRTSGAGQTVSFGVEGGELALGAGVVLGGGPGLLHAECGREESCSVRDGEGGRGRWAPGEVVELGGGGVRGEEGHVRPAAKCEHGGDLGYPLGVAGVAGECVEAEPTAVEYAEVGVPEQEA